MDGAADATTAPALLAVTLLLSSSAVEGGSDAEIFDTMTKFYKPNEAPDRFGSGSDYISVAVRAMLESLEVDEEGSAVTVHSLQRLTWDDVRLRYRSSPAAGGLVISHATAGLPSSPRIWLPSLVYPRALVVDFDNSVDNLFYIRPNGTITWQRRVHLMVPCVIQLKSFPWDENTCTATIRQDLDEEALMLNWTRIAGRPVQAGPHFSMNGFELSSLDVTSRSTTPDDLTGDSLRSKSLILRVTFKRQSDYYIINDIVPTSILVVAAYMTFWLATDAVLVRSLVASFLLLACVLVSAVAGRAAPPAAAALSALGVWNLTCLALLLWPLAQSLAVYHLARRAAATGHTKAQHPPPAANGEPDPEVVTSDSLPPPPADSPGDGLGPLPPPPTRLGTGAHPADLAGRALYPLAFGVLAIVFGVLYS